MARIVVRASSLLDRISVNGYRNNNADGWMLCRCGELIPIDAAGNPGLLLHNAYRRCEQNVILPQHMQNFIHLQDGFAVRIGHGRG